MLWALVQLENDLIRIEAVVLNSLLQFVLQNLQVDILGHCAVYSAHETGSLGCHAAPNHQRSPTVLYRLLDMVRLKLLTFGDPGPGASIGTETIDLGLIGPNDTLPVIHRPIFVEIGKLKSGLDVFGREHWLRFLLN